MPFPLLPMGKGGVGGSRRVQGFLSQRTPGTRPEGVRDLLTERFPGSLVPGVGWWGVRCVWDGMFGVVR